MGTSQETGHDSIYSGTFYVYGGVLYTKVSKTKVCYPQRTYDACEKNTYCRSVGD